MINHSNRRACLFATAMAALFCSTSAIAQDRNAPSSESADRFGLGLAVGSIKKPYAGVGDKTIAFPFVYYDTSWARIAGNQLDFKLPSAGPLAFQIEAQYDFAAGYKASDSSELSGMSDRKSAIWLGASSTFRNPYAFISLEYLADVSGHSKGQKIMLGAKHRFFLGSFQLTPRLEATWLDEKYVNYFYGVRAGEATAARAAYDGKATVNLGAGVRGDYRFLSNQSVFLDVGVTRLGSSIKDSAIVDRATTTSIFTGYVFQF